MTDKTMELILKSQFPKKRTDVNSHKIVFCKFESKKEAMSDPLRFNILVALTMGSEPEVIGGPQSITIDTAELLVKIGFAISKNEARRLMKQEAINIGEPIHGTRKMKDEKMMIEDPANTLLTINRAWSDWAFVTFEV